MPTRQVRALKPHDLRIIFSFSGYFHRRQHPLCGSLGSVGMLAMKSAKQTTKEANSIRPPFGFMIGNTTLSFQAFNEALKLSPICALAIWEFKNSFDIETSNTPQRYDLWLPKADFDLLLKCIHNPRHTIQ